MSALQSKILIRPYCSDDVESLYAAAIASRANLWPWLPWCHPDYSLTETQDWIQSQVEAFKSGTEYCFAIVDTDDHMLGGCGLNHLDKQNRFANLGYWVRSSHLRQGIATTATRQLVEWTFAYTNLVRLEILVAAENIASQRVAEKSGAQREGFLRKRVMLEGIAHDALLYSFVKDF